LLVFRDVQPIGFLRQAQDPGHRRYREVWTQGIQQKYIEQTMSIFAAVA
jgi:hypothetical protein